MGVLNKHKRMFLILFIVFTFGNGSTAPSRISHLLKLKKLHNRSLSAYSSHFFGQKSRVNYFRASINGQAFFSLRVDGNSGILPKWTFLKKLSKKCVSDIDFIPKRHSVMSSIISTDFTIENESIVVFSISHLFKWRNVHWHRKDLAPHIFFAKIHGVKPPGLQSAVKRFWLEG